MLRFPVRLAVALFGALLLLSCAGSLINPDMVPVETRSTPANIVPARKVAFRAGERMEIGFWLRSFPIGQVTVSVGEPCGRDTEVGMVVRSTGKSTGLLGQIKDAWVDIGSVLDVRTGLPLATRWNQEYDDLARYEVEYERDRYWSRSIDARNRARMRPRPVPCPVHDLHSVIGLVRAWDPVPGVRGHAYLVVGRALWRIELELAGRETVSTSLGEREALHIDGIAQRLRLTFEPASSKPRGFALWISDDGDRLPLKLAIESDLGEVQAEMLSYSRPPPNAPVVGTDLSLVRSPASPTAPSATARPTTAAAPPPAAGSGSATLFPHAPACSEVYQASPAYRLALEQETKTKQAIARGKARGATIPPRGGWPHRVPGTTRPTRKRPPGSASSEQCAGAATPSGPEPICRERPAPPPPDPSSWRAPSPAGSTLAPVRPPP